MTFHQVIRWATQILVREMQSETYGSVTFKFDRGVIVSVKTERNEKPTLDD